MKLESKDTIKGMEAVHFLMEHVEEMLDANRSMQEEINSLKAENAEQKASLESFLKDQREDLIETKARLDDMDKMLPKGQKFYQPLPTEKAQSAEVRRELALFMLDGMSYRLDNRTRFESESFKLAQTEGVDEDGGFLVPPEQLAEIVKIMETYGLARRLFRMLPMARKELRVPTKDGDITMEWPDEGTDSPDPDTTATFLRPAITAKRMTGLTTLSLEVIEDSIPLITDYLIDEYGKAVAKEEDKQGLTGGVDENSDPFDGILYHDDTTEVTMQGGYTGFANVDYDELVNLMDGIDEFSAERGVWVMSNSILNVIRKIKDENGRPLFITGDMTNGMAADVPGTLFGRPWYRSAVMPKIADSGVSKCFLFFGDMQMFAMGDRKSMSIDFSREADFKKGNVVMRVMERVGFQMLQGAAIGRLKTAAA